jgi:hypothetical protein
MFTAALRLDATCLISRHILLMLRHDNLKWGYCVSEIRCASSAFVIVSHVLVPSSLSNSDSSCALLLVTVATNNNGNIFIEAYVSRFMLRELLRVHNANEADKISELDAPEEIIGRFLICRIAVITVRNVTGHDPINLRVAVYDRSDTAKLACVRARESFENKVRVAV